MSPKAAVTSNVGDGRSGADRPPALRICLFGHARVFVNGETFRLTTPRKTLPVLAYLLLNRASAVSRSFLSFLLWPDETEEDARSKLRATLYDLVRVLPAAPDGHWIQTEGSSIRWNPDAEVACDVEEFEAALADPERIDRAAELYAGDLLEACYDEWVVAPRERFRSAHQGALDQLISRSRRRLDFPKAIGYAKRLLESDPLREDVARRLIALRYEAGDRAGALAEYERFERLLREELDVDPMPETVALRESIVRNDAIEHEKVDDLKPAASPKTALPFVGRHAEMEQLLDVWGRAARGRGTVVFVGGEPGIGKSRLVAELAREVEQRGGRVAIGATGSPETMPYQAFVEALRSALPLLSAAQIEGAWLAVLSTLLPELTVASADAPTVARIEPDNEPARVFGALTRAFAALAQTRPMLLILEDMHWAERSSIAALEFLARRLALAPILVVATYRDDETGGRHLLRRARIDTTTANIARTMLLRPLSLDDVAHVAKEIAAIPPDSARALHKSTDGNPLLLAQLLEDPANIRFDDVPKLSEVIDARLERLTPEARAVAEVASLMGQRFSGEVVREAGGWDPAAFQDALDELVERRIVREATGRGAFDYAFGHQAICEAVASEATARRAPDRHRRIARSIEKFHPELLPEFAATVARHYELAGEPDGAARHLLSAGKRALDLAAVDEARTHIARGLTLACSADVRKALLVVSGQVSQRRGDRDALASAADELAALAEAADDGESRRTAALMRLRYATAAHDEQAHEVAIDRLRDLAIGAGAKWRAILHLEEARSAYGRTELDALKTAATEALKAARECGDGASEARALAFLADGEMNRGNLAGAQTFLEQAQEAAAHANDGEAELEALRSAFIMAYNNADVDRSVWIAQRWLERGVALGDRLAEASARLRIAIAMISTRRGIARIRDELSTALSTFTEFGWKRGIAGAQLNLGILENEVGNFAEAARVTQLALEIFEPLGDARGEATALANLATLHAALGDGQRALREAKRSAAVARKGGLRLSEALALENIAIATALSGKTAEAVRLGDEVLAIHRELEFKPWSGRLLGDLALWQAELGQLDAARARVDQMLVEGVHIWAETPQRFHWAAAQVLHVCGDTTAAARELSRAFELVKALEAELADGDLERYRSVSWNRAIVAARERDEWPPLPAGRNG